MRFTRENAKLAKTLPPGLAILAACPTTSIALRAQYLLPSRLDDNPLIWMIQLDNGLIIDIRHAPREAQVAAYEHGLIPYIPADREPPGENEND